MLREVRVENGLVRGIPAADPRITAFKGIPYAAPPVGELRWRSPQPAKDWDGVLDCSRFGPIAMQETPGLDPNAFYSKEWHVDPEIPMSEDCLQLSIWTPAKSQDEKLPVMVWIFGGGLYNGYPAEMEFDGERFARRGVILVSINYRLNAFGFLAHPEITKEDPEYPTNFGHLDQRFALQWIKRNISAFGGDPENILLFGQSAGGGSTFMQVISPLNKGLFQKAIHHSSGGQLLPALDSFTLKDAEKMGEQFFEDLGVKTLEEARALPAEKIVELGKLRKYNFGTVVGDSFMPDYPTSMITDGKRNDITIMTGNTGNEFQIRVQGDTLDEIKQYAEMMFGNRGQEYIDIISKGTDDIEQIKKNGQWNRFAIGNYIWLDMNIEQGKPDFYYYYFNPEIPGDDAGSFHSSDLWFAFETLAKCWRPFKGKHYDLARQMCNYWTNFAKNGDPNGLDNDGTPMPVWRPASKDDVHPMYFGDVAAMDESPRSELDNFLVDYYSKKLKAKEKITFGRAVGRRADGSLIMKMN